MREAQSAIMSKFAPRSIRISVALALTVGGGLGEDVG